MISLLVISSVLVLCECRNFGPTVVAPMKFQYGDYMTSNNSQFHAIMQQDGNFVIYRGSLADHPEDAVWRTRTNQHSNGPYHADLQSDNDFAVHDVYQSVLWHTKTQGKGTAPAKLTLLNDGNLVLYDAYGKRLWSSAAELKGKPKPSKKPRSKKPLFNHDSTKKRLLGGLFTTAAPQPLPPIAQSS